MSPRFGFPRRGKDADAAAPVAAAEFPEPAAPAEAAESPDRPISPEPAAPADQASPEPTAPPEPTIARVEPTERQSPGARDLRRGMATLATYERAVLSWVAKDGYPMNVDIPIDVRMAERAVRFSEPAGFNIDPGAEVALTGSRIAALPDGGFEGRSHVTIWGVASARPRARFAVSPVKVWVWDEDDLPPPVAYERDLPKARRYFEALSEERTEPVRPKPPSGLVAFRVTHAPFLGATFAPVVLGLAVAARANAFDVVSAVLLLAAVSAVHVGLNVGGDLFDAMRGMDPGGAQGRGPGDGSPVPAPRSRLRRPAPAAVACYAIAAALGAVLMATRFSPALAGLGATALVIGLAYGFPFIGLAHRGLDEVATAIVFGPLLLVGAYVVQSGGPLSPEAAALSVAVGILAALVVYVNEVRRREADEKAGRRTLPVRWPKSRVVAGYRVAVTVPFAVVVAGVGVGLLPIPALLVLLLIPLAARVNSGLVNAYDEPHAQWNTAVANTLLHANFSLILLLAYILVVADFALLKLRPYFWY